jgi:hypothetical protein
MVISCPQVKIRIMLPFRTVERDSNRNQLKTRAQLGHPLSVQIRLNSVRLYLFLGAGQLQHYVSSPFSATLLVYDMVSTRSLSQDFSMETVAIESHATRNGRPSESQRSQRPNTPCPQALAGPAQPSTVKSARHGPPAADALRSCGAMMHAASALSLYASASLLRHTLRHILRHVVPAAYIQDCPRRRSPICMPRVRQIIVPLRRPVPSLYPCAPHSSMHAASASSLLQEPSGGSGAATRMPKKPRPRKLH